MDVPESYSSVDNAKSELLDIIDTLVLIVCDNRTVAQMRIKRILARFRRKFYRTPGFNLSNMTLRVRVKMRMMAAFMFSFLETFPNSERLWRMLHNYSIREWEKGRRIEPDLPPEYVIDFPEKAEELLRKENDNIVETDIAIKCFPIESGNDYSHMIMAFDLYRHLAHINSFGDAISKPYDENWLNVNPYQLPKGKSMLVDYFWGLSINDRPFFHKILEELSSDRIKTVNDLLRLREEVVEWQGSTA